MSDTRDWRNLLIALLVGIITGGIGGLGVFQWTAPWTRERGVVLTRIEQTEKRQDQLQRDMLRQYEKMEQELLEIRETQASIKLDLGILINESKR